MMKVDIGPLKGAQVRTQTRTVTTTEFIYRGKVIAKGEAVLNPVDEFDEEKGTRLSALRAAQEVRNTVETYGLSGYPRYYSCLLIGLNRKISAKFRKQRERAKRLLDIFFNNFPSIRSLPRYVPRIK
jgi:hypothetical protein